MRKILYRLGFTFLIGLPLVGLIYQLPPVKDRLAWRVDELRGTIKYALAPPEQAIFVPQQQGEKKELPLPQVSTTTPVPSPTLVPIQQTATVQPTLIPTVTPSPLPDQIRLSGVRHEYQGWNNCGPATLAMALSYWDWQGDQYDIAPVTKPNPRDKNVMPYELAGYVETRTELKVLARAGGDLQMIKQLVAAGFLVMVEKGFEGPNVNDWMGHYVLVTGYDNNLASFFTQDSYNGPDLPFPYDQMESYWRAFNFTYLVVYPEDRQSDVQAILGPRIDEAYSDRAAAEKASDEISSLSGRDQYFAWFNRGTSLVALQDYAGAASAFDQAFALYPA
ncbi:MAG TPA: C39 family peptidase, partial [Anaerolineales bacterium]|nr:C39 family peptidase [Anaerolineales bacterium]